MKRKADCWYNKVCSYDSCINCIRYAEMKYLMENSGIPKARQMPISLEAGRDYDAFVSLALIKDNILQFVERGDNLYICSEETDPALIIPVLCVIYCNIRKLQKIIHIVRVSGE